MPLSIIRNDITRVRADAIVNTANPRVAVGRGTDYAIYKAAGIDKLLEARNMIGDIAPGSAAVTPAFGLDAKYIIHTVGPAWLGGSHGERETVAACYRNCLSEAARLECGSIAFPLISTGTYGFPKDEALDIAIREITEFLDLHEIDVELVVYDRESFVLSSELFEDIRAYIDDADYESSEASYMQEMQEDASCDLYEERAYMQSLMEAGGPAPESSLNRTMRAPAPPADKHAGSKGATGKLYSKKEIDNAIASLIKNKDESFQQKLFGLIDAKGLTDPEVYKKANIDRKLFSKIRSNADYKPTKKTAVAFAVALGLNLDETTDLLRSAGLSLSPSSSFDIIIRYCIEHRITNIHEINCILFEFDQMLLGA